MARGRGTKGSVSSDCRKNDMCRMRKRQLTWQVCQLKAKNPRTWVALCIVPCKWILHEDLDVRRQDLDLDLDLRRHKKNSFRVSRDSGLLKKRRFWSTRICCFENFCKDDDQHCRTSGFVAVVVTG